MDYPKFIVSNQKEESISIQSLKKTTTVITSKILLNIVKIRWRYLSHSL